MSEHIIGGIALDLGDGVIKPQRWDAQGQTHPIMFGENDTCISAVYRDGKTGKMLYGVDAQHEGFVDHGGLAMNSKRNLGSDEKLYFHGTATAADVAAYIVKYVAELAETQSGVKTTDLVLTVPANIPDKSKSAFVNAAKSTGQNILAVLTEPTAAVLGFGYQKNLGNAGVLVNNVDPGSSTTDASLVRLANGEAIVVSSEGDNTVGGQDVRYALYELVLDRAKKAKRLKPSDMERLTPVEQLNLLLKCEEAMKALTERPSARIPLTFPEKASIIEIQQDEYESLILEPFVQKVLACNDRACARAKLKPSDCQYVFLTGGPGRSKYVQKRVSEHTGMPLTMSIHPQRQTVIGAALHGYWLQKRAAGGKDVGVLGGIEVKESTPWPIGMIVEHLQPDGSYVERSHILLDKGQRAPQTVTQAFGLRHAHLTSCVCRFVQCEKSGMPPEECHELGTAKFENIPPETVQTPRIEVTLNFDSAAMVNIAARDRVSNTVKEVRLIPLDNVQIQLENTA